MVSWARAVSRSGTHLASFVSRISWWSPASWAARVPLEGSGITSVLLMDGETNHLYSPMFLEHTGFQATGGDLARKTNP